MKGFYDAVGGDGGVKGCLVWKNIAIHISTTI